MKSVKKITLKECGLSSKVLVRMLETYLPMYEKTGRDIPLMRVSGRVDSHKIAVSTKNAEKEYTRFIGEFQARNVATGEIYRSFECILPEVGEIAVRSAMSTIKDGESVTFIMDIGMKPTYKEDPGSMPYQFGADVHGESKPLDFLTELEEMAPPPPQLPDPADLKIEDKTEETEKTEKTEKSAKKKK